MDWGDGPVGKVCAAQACYANSDPRHLCKQLCIFAHV